LGELVAERASPRQGAGAFDAHSDRLEARFAGAEVLLSGAGIVATQGFSFTCTGRKKDVAFPLG
jgi:hypothetical protein